VLGHVKRWDSTTLPRVPTTAATLPPYAVILTEVRRQPNEVEGPRVPSRPARTPQNSSRRTAGAPGAPCFAHFAKRGILRTYRSWVLANDYRLTTNDYPE
jgi:hypothetical protein